MSEIRIGNQPIGIDQLEQQYLAAVATLGFLGYSGPYVPRPEAVRNYIERKDGLVDWLAQRSEQVCNDELLIAPSVRDVGLIGDKKNPGIVSRSNILHDAYYNTPRAWQMDAAYQKSSWAKYGDKDKCHDGGLECPPQYMVYVLLGDKIDPRYPTEDIPANSVGEPGLVYTNMTTKQQREALTVEADMHGAAGRNIRPATIGQMAVAHARRVWLGLPGFTHGTITRFTNYEGSGQYGRGTPAARAESGNTRTGEGNLRLEGCDDTAGEKIGVRRALILNIVPHDEAKSRRYWSGR